MTLAEDINVTIEVIAASLDLAKGFQQFLTACFQGGSS